MDLYLKIFKTIIKVNVIVPGKFKTNDGRKAMATSLGPSQGMLYLLDHSFLFIRKPIIHLPYSQIKRIDLHRFGGEYNNKTFDISVLTTQGNSYMFHGIDKAHKNAVQLFLKKKDIVLSIVEENPSDDQQEIHSAMESGNDYADDGDFINEEVEPDDKSDEDYKEEDDKSD